MDLFTSYVLSLLLPLFIYLLLPMFFYIIVFLYKNKSNNSAGNLPPGTSGWPIAGENTEYVLLGAEKFVQQRMDKYSHDVFRTSLFGENIVLLCGAKGNKFLFGNENKLVTGWWPQSIAKTFLYPGFVGNEFRALAHSLLHVHGVLKLEMIKQYIPTMDVLAREHMDRDWAPNSVVKVFPLSKKYTFELACRLFINVVNPDQIHKLAYSFIPLINGLLSVPINLPGMAYNRAIKGGALVREEIMKVIMQRKKEMDNEGRDLLSKMLHMMKENGDLLTEKEICMVIMSLLVASYATTSSAITSVINDLASLPHIYEGVFKEQMEIAKSKGPLELLTWEDIEKMKFSWNVVRESLRLTPTGPGGFGEVMTEFTYAGFTIPKGWKTFWSVHTSHKNPKYFPDPEKFDPSRFEGSGPPPFTFVPFGGGPRMCLGKEYARIEILVFIHNVVTRFNFEKVFPKEKIVLGAAAATPVHGLPIRLLPQEK